MLNVDSFVIAHLDNLIEFNSEKSSFSQHVNFGPDDCIRRNKLSTKRVHAKFAKGRYKKRRNNYNFASLVSIKLIVRVNI